MTAEQKAHIRKWVDALRSGRYQQGRGSLHGTPQEFCCLGVACDIYRQETGNGEWQSPFEFEEDDTYFMLDGQLYQSLPPTKVDDYFGIDPIYHKPEFDLPKFITMNDEDKLTFEQIADVIERTLL